jgi:cell division protein FtsW
MLLFILLITSIVQISFDALRQNRLFQGYVCFGIGSLLSIQSIFNIGVNIGLLPTKGLTLPFISYGGASLIIFMFMMGIVFRVDFENRNLD